MTNRDRLQALEIRVAKAVCHVEGVVTKAENDELDRLRAVVGANFDAINRVWTVTGS